MVATAGDAWCMTSKAAASVRNQHHATCQCCWLVPQWRTLSAAAKRGSGLETRAVKWAHQVGREAHLLRQVLIGLLVGIRGADAHILRRLCLQQNLQPGTLDAPEPVAEQPGSGSRASGWPPPAQTVQVQAAATALVQPAGPSQTCATEGSTGKAACGSECCELNAREPLHGTWLQCNLRHEVVNQGSRRWTQGWASPGSIILCIHSYTAWRSRESCCPNLQRAACQVQVPAFHRPQLGHPPRLLTLCNAASRRVHNPCTQRHCDFVVCLRLPAANNGSGRGSPIRVPQVEEWCCKLADLSALMLVGSKCQT